jgi:MFS transporter, DHA2 family, multidrug resistance protein
MTATTYTPTQTAGRRAWLGLAVLALPAMLVVMDLTVLFLAVPKITADLHPSSTQLLWITDIYGFLIAGSLIAMGALGDRIGRRKVLLTGAAGFGAASLLSAFSTSPEMLIVARGLQGIAGATLVPSTMALVFNMFPDELERTKALGIVMSSFAAGAAVGPVLGGVILDSLPWGAVFLVNVPVMALLLIAGPRLLPEFNNPEASRIDLVSVALSVAGVLAVVYGVKELARDGYTAAPAASVAAGLVLATLFVSRQRRVDNPLIDLSLFRSAVFSTLLTANVIGALVQYGIYLFTSQYLQLALGLSPLEAGLLGLPSVAALMVASGTVPRLVQHLRPGSAIAGGMAITATGFLAITQIGAEHGTTLLVGSTMLMTLGVAPAMVLGTQLIVGAVPPERAGVASGMSQTANEFGGAMGIALLGSLGTLIYRHNIDDAIPQHVAHQAASAARDTLGGAVSVADALPASVLSAAHEAFVSGLHVVAVTAAVLMLGTAAVAAVTLRNVKAPSSEPQAEDTTSHDAAIPATAIPALAEAA